MDYLNESEANLHLILRFQKVAAICIIKFKYLQNNCCIQQTL